MGANNSSLADYDTTTYVLLSLHAFLTTAAVVGRMMSRRLMKAVVSTDDHFAYAAHIANIVILVDCFLLTAFGALNPQRLAFHTEKDQRLVRYMYNSLAVMYIFTITLVKLSILFLYRRLFTMAEMWFRWTWCVMFSIIVLWTAACIVLIALQDMGTVHRVGFSKLWVSITGIVNAVSDVALLVLPTVVVSRMKLPRRQKVALISIFGLGGVASIVSIVRATVFFMSRNHSLSEAYSNYLDIILTATESSAGLMCACLPLTRPIFVRVSHWMREWHSSHSFWVAESASLKSRSSEPDRTSTEAFDYFIELPSSFSSGAMLLQTETEGRDTVEVERSWSVDVYETMARYEHMT